MNSIQPQPRQVQSRKSRRQTQMRTPAPQSRPQPQPRKHHYVRNTLLSILFTLILLVIAVMALFLYTYAKTEIPRPSEFARAQITTVYYADGKTEIGKFAEVNREIIDTTKIPKYVGNAVVASEDRTFWTNSGVDIKGIIRAFINNAKGKSLQGASTLSQQYVERYYMSENTSKGNVFQRYWAKAKEAILALKINRQQDKEEILDNYMNTIYFGRGSYGIEAAAKAYFGKPAKELNYSEAAMLSGIIPAPSAYDPAVNLEMAKKRWLRVLTYMADSGYITPTQKLTAEFPETLPPSQSKQSFSGVNGYFMFQVRRELKELAGLSEEQIDTQGLKIVTTIDQSKQQLMMDTVAKLPKGYSENLRVAMISTDPTTGEIIAEYPGVDYLKIQTNAATQDHFQAGSTFKPFGLVAYLENGGSLKDVYNANSPATIQGQQVRNFGNYSYGNVTMSTATAKSLNVPYVRMNAKIGPAITKETAIRLGLPENTPGLDNALTNVLGSSSPTALDLATAFGTIANEGKREVVHLIRQVTDASGDIIYMPSFRPEKVLDRNVALSATQALQGTFAPGGTAVSAKIGRPTAGKTGSASYNKSATFVGYIPQMLTVVGLYQAGADGTEESITPFGGHREITGSTWPAWLWKQYMSQATKDLKVEQFPKPGKITKTEVSPSKKPETSESPEATATPSATPSETPSRDQNGQNPNPNGTVTDGGTGTGENPLPQDTPGTGTAPGTQPGENGGAGTGDAGGAGAGGAGGSDAGGTGAGAGGAGAGNPDSVGNAPGGANTGGSPDSVGTAPEAQATN